MPDSQRDKLLLLGGTGEALALARRLGEAMPNLLVVNSLAGRTRDPVLPTGEIRVGGFGGLDGLIEYVGENAVSLLVNATHPFAAEMSAHALAAHRATGVSLLRLLRLAWRKQPADSWIKTPDAEAAAGICRWLGKRVFLTLGAQEIGLFADLPRAHFLVRMVDAPAQPLPLARCDVITGRGPFSLADERRLMLEHGIDLVVARNSGGDATFAKIVAARELSIPVIMIERPQIALHPGSDTVHTVDEAMAWIAAWHGNQMVRSFRTGDSSASSGEKA